MTITVNHFADVKMLPIKSKERLFTLRYCDILMTSRHNGQHYPSLFSRKPHVL